MIFHSYVSLPEGNQLWIFKAISDKLRSTPFVSLWITQAEGHGSSARSILKEKVQRVDGLRKKGIRLPGRIIITIITCITIITIIIIPSN